MFLCSANCASLTFSLFQMDVILSPRDDISIQMYTSVLAVAFVFLKNTINNETLSTGLNRMRKLDPRESNLF